MRGMTDCGIVLRKIVFNGRVDQWGNNRGEAVRACQSRNGEGDGSGNGDRVAVASVRRIPQGLLPAAA